MSVFRRLKDYLQTEPEKTASFTDAQKAMQTRLEDQGRFSYEEDGFNYTFSDGPQKIKWADIERISVYKLDRLTMDDICMDIVWHGYEMTITEETRGWAQFTERIREAFPSIPENWESEVAQPPFATNFTLLYKREDRKPS